METLKPSPQFPEKYSNPLHPLSPERINRARRPSSTTSPTTRTTRTTESDNEEAVYSANSSPTRKGQVSFFADYRPDSISGTQVSGFALPQSPSLPEINTIRRNGHTRTNSDVQGLVKRFEHLDVRDKDVESSEKRKRLEAELRRAQIAREEAESDVKRLREEGRRLKKEGDEGRERERKVGRRLEVVMEEFQVAKETYAAQSAVYEKELRKARKEAFKSSSAVLKVQDELKSTRNSLRITQSGLELERQKVERKEQERFEMEYRLIPLQEQLERLQQQLKVVQEERDGLKTNLKEEEVARIAAEGKIALPTSQEVDDDLNSPKKSPRKRPQSPLSDDKENMHAVTRKASENRRLLEELDDEKMRREYAEALVDFMQMECKFRCCTCKVGSQSGHDLTVGLDAELVMGVEKIRDEMRNILPAPRSYSEQEQMDMDVEPNTEQQESDAGLDLHRVSTVEVHEPATHDLVVDNEVDDYKRGAAKSRDSFSPFDEPLAQEEAPMAPRPTPVAADHTQPSHEEIAHVPLEPPSPQTIEPQQPMTPFRRSSIRTVTTTTTVPMLFTPVSKPIPLAVRDDQENVPPTIQISDLQPNKFDRAAALAAIEYRRGRAKSFAAGHLTPRKQMVEGIKERRDVSAPTFGGKVGDQIQGQKINYAKGAGSVGRGMKGRAVL